ncbi:MAG: hypothetical protein KDH96_12160, partial [Candidatus Riesia sp.]|nr:hypothetical protein [Candidatus Riesia sp.]
NVFTKKLLNGSTLYLRYALLTPDRLRGISSDFNLWDETQDMIQDIIPVVDKSMSRSYYKKRIFFFIPKLSRGTLAHYWNRSTRNEWMVKCSGCSKYNYLDEANIGKQGLICRYCGHLMDPQRGSWVRTGPANADLEGFRVCALQFANAPWVDWQKDIVKEMENSSRAVFFNEVLGIAYDPGVAPVTEEEVRTCCSNQPMLDSPTEDMISRGPIYMGIDYGPANSEHSFTVVSILQPWQGKTHVLHMKRFTGKEADFHYIHNEVPRMFKHWRCQMIGADYGLGEASNSEIRSHIGDTRLIPFFHTTQKERLAYNDKIGAYTTSRVRVMTEFFTKIKKQKFVFPKWEHFETFADDILNVAIDYNLDNTKFKYVNSDADDALHSILYADLLTQLDAPRHITYSYQFEDPNNDYY